MRQLASRGDDRSQLSDQSILAGSVGISNTRWSCRGPQILIILWLSLFITGQLREPVHICPRQYWTTRCSSLWQQFGALRLGCACSRVYLTVKRVLRSISYQNPILLVQFGESLGSFPFACRIDQCLHYGLSGIGQ